MIHPRTLEALEYGKIVSFFASLCLSANGREKAGSLKPLPDGEAARTAFCLFEEASVWLSWPGSKKFTPASFPDVRDILAVARKHGMDNSPRRMRLDLDAFWALREMLRQAQKAMDSLTDESGARNWPHLMLLAQEKPLPVQLLAALNRCLSDDGLLKDESSPELFRLRNEMRGLHQNCLRKVKDFAQQYNMLPWLQDEFMTLSSDRYVLPLKANFKGRMQGIIHDWSQTGETCYFEPIFLVEVNNRLQELKHEEREEEQKILDYLSGLLNDDLPGAEAALELLTTIDLLNAKILFAQKLAACCPDFTTDENGIELLHARHPLLALARDEKDARQAVRPLDIILRPGDRALVITGGNAGGKTVCLKTLGLVSALAMSGMPVPVDRGSHLPWFERMDAFIGDEQSLDANVSTFTAQIDHLSKAWKHLNNRGLVLLDEFGAGTDPAEGAALAQAVLDGLLEKKCFVLSATHFPALKSYALTREGVRAASMLFNPANNKPLFKLAYDQVGSSQALLVAQEHGLPESILARARHYLLQDGQDSSALLTRLNALAAEREVEIEHLRSEEEKARSQLREKTEKLDRERQKLQVEMRSHITSLMRAWKEGRQNARQTLKEMSGLREELGLGHRDDAQSILPSLDNLGVGQTVFHVGFNKKAVIKDIDTRKNRVRLDLNGVGVWADMKDIRESAGPAATTAQKSSSGPRSMPAGNASLNVDVRGMRSDEALAEVERFLDRALLAGFSEVEIVHGRGTGALRREIHQFLRSFPAVGGFMLAPEDRGGDGMTIVELN